MAVFPPQCMDLAAASVIIAQHVPTTHRGPLIHQPHPDNTVTMPIAVAKTKPANTKGIIAVHRDIIINTIGPHQPARQISIAFVVPRYLAHIQTAQ